MGKLAKRVKANNEKIDKMKKYSVDEAFKLIEETSTAKFDETVDVAVKLGVDPKQSDQQVRGSVSLPNGLGKTVRVVVFARGPKEKEATEAGADFVGADDLVEKIKGGWLEFDKAIATPDMMATVSKVAKVLGPRGLMPNPKVGTVTMNVADAVAAEKKGKCSFRVEKAGIVHAGIGKKSMGAEKLKENYLSLVHALMKAKPSSSKGVYLRQINVSSTMGAGIPVDVSNTTATLK
ncbi:MAG: 50S ribosomal protein L1 [Bdellovibrionales bacterium]|nr:50S ribosomal protein L1 [Bdellovibrionales bacterium]NQZ20134.1 50S ribosomal protein L1 [Bdellovibrionales bacterium]